VPPGSRLRAALRASALVEGLVDRPGFAAGEESLQVGLSLRFGGGDLGDQGFFVAGAFDGGEDADGRRELWGTHAGEEIGERGVGFVVDQEVGFGDAVAERHDLGTEVAEANALVLRFAEDEGLPVLEDEGVLGLAVFFGDVAEGAVVEDVAVLEDLDEGAALVRVGPLDDLLQVLRRAPARWDRTGDRSSRPGSIS
jgi:hypothetical protein